ARLLQGRCFREQEQFEKAAELLASSAASQSREDVLVEALFEIARNKIEQAASIIRDKENENRVQESNEVFTDADKAVDAFAARAGKVHPQLGVDVKTLVLRHYLYEQWAAAMRVAGQGEQAEKYDKKAQQAFLEFLEKYKEPSIRAAVGKLFREKFRGRKINLQTMDPVIVLLLAMLEMNEADDLQGGRDWNSLSQPEKDRIRRNRDRARDMFESIRKSTSPTARSAVPDALWNLGVIYVKQLENFKAAEMFRELVNRFPKHKQAYTAALNAVKITSDLISDLVEKEKPISQQRRIQLVESLRVMLKNWARKPEAAKYHFDLAWQCEKLSQSDTEEKADEWITEAIENYEKVPRDSALYQWARFEALELRYQRLLKRPDGQEKLKETRDLRDAMIRYGGAVHDLWR
ncbi:MAG: tetratricopeptide repeat protein, partial [Candidatus Hydrogenedentes bacterium]|nr:tetratricopeptide repeat protein [Candidatus Hydrogenedentota bacterium]